jgi:hypothetical protein
LYKTSELIVDIKRKWLVWLVHVSRRNETSVAGAIFERKWPGKKNVGRPILRMMWGGMERTRAVLLRGVLVRLNPKC